MKCPLRMITRPGLMLPEVHPSDDCKKEQCAWWDSIIQQCLIYAFHTDLAYLCALLKELVEKMSPKISK